jgi:hypothetical protein
MNMKVYRVIFLVLVCFNSLNAQIIRIPSNEKGNCPPNPTLIEDGETLQEKVELVIDDEDRTPPIKIKSNRLNGCTLTSENQIECVDGRVFLLNRGTNLSERVSRGDKGDQKKGIYPPKKITVERK